MNRDLSQPASGRSPWWNDFSIPADVHYLNHGSFGPSPRSVQKARHAWSARLESQPMQFFVREMEEGFDQAYHDLGEFVGADADDLIFVDNATFGMNVVAGSVELSAGDEILLGDQEYGAVLNIWRNRCKQTGAKLVVAPLPVPVTDADELVAALFAHATPRTKLIVISHVTSPTAIILPVEAICREARHRKIATCIDGPHAPAMVPLNLRQIGCDYYTASCHKWLSAPFGCGFLYVRRALQQKIQPLIVSWGGSVSGREKCWKDAFHWVGTRDPASFLSVSAAIGYLRQVGLERFRDYSHGLAQQARKRIAELTGHDALVPDDPLWYGSMIALPMPNLPDDSSSEIKHLSHPLQIKLWREHRIEVPIPEWKGTRYLRVSCHLYTAPEDIDALLDALEHSL